MTFKNNPRFTPQVEQQIRERLARSRNSFQILTRDIYPETESKSVETSEKNLSETKENAPRFNDHQTQAIQGGSGSSTPPQNESSKVCQDLSMHGGEK